jgi:hypothetical protein
VFNPFHAPGPFLKGNLHLHTTQSDGRLEPQEAIDLYRDAGYDFLAITDHNRLTLTSGLDTRGITLLPGMELDQGRGELEQTVHIVAIGMETSLEVPQTRSLQSAITYISARSKFCFIAHPNWSSLTYRDLLGAKGHVGLEVFNTTCERGIGRGDSSETWNQLLARGERLLGFAVDDAHMHYPDALGGWVMLKAGSNAPEDILSALISGAFYSSSGPTIEDVSFAEDHVTVRCSPCQAVNLISPRPGCGATAHAVAGGGAPYTHVSLPFAPRWAPVRIECVDEHGRKAWTNPFWLD